MSKDTQSRLRFFNGRFIASIKKPENIREVFNLDETREKLKPVELNEAEVFLFFPEIAPSREDILNSKRAVFNIDRETGRVKGNIEGNESIKLDSITEYADSNGTYQTKNPNSSVNLSVFKSATDDSLFSSDDFISFEIDEVGDNGEVLNVISTRFELLYTHDGTYTTSYDGIGNGLSISFEIETKEGRKGLRFPSIINAGTGYEVNESFKWSNPIGEFIVKETLTDGTWSIPVEELEEGFYYTFEFSEESEDEECFRDCATYFARTIRVGNRFELVPQRRMLAVPVDSIIDDPDRVPDKVVTANPDSLEGSVSMSMVNIEGSRESGLEGSEDGLIALQFEGTAAARESGEAVLNPDIRIPVQDAIGIANPRIEPLERLANNLVFYLPKNIILNPTLNQRI
jgi:hypothetical protein